LSRLISVPSGGLNCEFARHRITNVLEVEFPVFVGLIGQMLRLAGNGVDLTPRGADFLDDSLVPVAP